MTQRFEHSIRLAAETQLDLRFGERANSFFRYGSAVIDAAIQRSRQERLRELNLSGTFIKGNDLVRLRELPDLSWLDLHGVNDLSDELVSQLPLERLVGLSVDGRHVTDAGLQLIAKHDNLRSLTLGPNVSVSGSGLAELSALKYLEELRVYSGYISDENVEFVFNLKQLRCLLLNGGNLTDVGLESLQQLEKLQGLTLNQPAVKGQAFSLVRSELTSLYLGSTGVTDSRFDATSFVSFLKVLDLSCTAVRDGVAKQLMNAGQLEKLALQGTSFGDKGLELLSHLTSLKVLILGAASEYTRRNLKLTDAGLRSISQLKGLKRLDLTKTSVGDVGVSALSELKELTILNLAGTMVTDKGVETLLSLGNLREICLRRTSVSASVISALRDRQIYVHS